MQVEEQNALQTRIAQLEKRLKTAESQCQATTKEIWQMEVELARMEERVQEAEQRAAEAEAKVSAAPAPTAQAPSDDGLVAQLEEELNAAQAQEQSLRAQLDQAIDNLRLVQEQLENAEERAQIAQEAADAEASRGPDPMIGVLEEELTRARETEATLRAQLGRAEERVAELAGLEERLQQSEERFRHFEHEQLESAQLFIEAQTIREQLQNLTGERDHLVNTEQALRGQLSALQFEVDELRSRSSDLEDQLEQAQQQRSSAQEQLAEAMQHMTQLPGSDSAELMRLQQNLALSQEKSELLQQRLEQLQARYDLSEEKASLYQQKSGELDGRIAEFFVRAQQAEEEARTLKERLERMESRVRDADQIYAAAETQIREAEAKHQESWQRVQAAEMRANQAVVENKKLADKLAEHERRAQESDRETQRLAFQDPLTGLPNINLLGQYLDFTVKQCARYRRVAALLVVDIDRFKVFNEAMGLKAGDELLAKVAERLQQAIRETDSLGRKGEDEFLILLSELNVGEHNVPEHRLRAIHQHVEVVANRVMQMMAPPFTVQGQKFYLQVSIGIAICPDDGESPQALLENADTAMYHVKETGRNRHHFYSSDLRRRQEKRLSLDMQLRSALERNEFEVKYHPVISLAKGKGNLVGVESLLRWNHRIEGVVGPDYFLPAAEESGMIIPIGNWVLQQTCVQMREWLSQGLRIFASVNLSKRQLLQADLVECISRELTQNGIPPEVLYVEIAEGFNTFNPELMDQVVTRLGMAGIRIAIDDFGVGYSSLSRLNLNYTRVLKIDKSIVDGCPHDRQSSTVCIAAINLASSLGLLSLAEGVENANQVKFLTKYGCALAQGYYFSEPVLPAEITAFHRTKKVWKV